MQTSHRLSKPIEYSRAADNTTFGVQVIALEGGRAADDTTYGIQSLADVNVKIVKEVAVPLTTRRSAYNSSRMPTSHRLSKPMEYGRAADDTTFGVQVFALGTRPRRRRDDIRHTITCGCQRRTS